MAEPLCWLLHRTEAILRQQRWAYSVANQSPCAAPCSNEIGGDGDVPHAFVAPARRMQVPSGAAHLQHRVMIEAVENHMPEVRLPASVTGRCGHSGGGASVSVA